MLSSKRFLKNLYLLVAVFIFTITLLNNAHSQGGVLNYKDADLITFIQDVSIDTGKTFLIEPGVKGKVNVVSSESVSGDMLYQTFLSVLKLNGYSISFVSENTYKIQKIENVINDFNVPEGETPQDKIEVRVFEINFVDPEFVQDAIKPYLHKDGVIFTRREFQKIIIGDFKGNLNKISKIISQIDEDNRVVKNIKLDNTSVNEMKIIIEKLSVTSGSDSPIYQPLQIIPMENSDSIVLVGPQETVDRIMPLIYEIDKQNFNRSNLRVHKLKYASSEDVIQILENLLPSIERGAESGNKVSFSNYQGSNKILISAPNEIQNKIADMINEIDQPRHQVLVEAIIVEVSDEAIDSLGMQFILAGGDGSDVPFTVNNFSQSLPDILSTTGALVVKDTDANSSVIDALRVAAIDSLTGIDGFALGGGGTRSDGSIFGVILNAVAKDVGSNILSTPSLVTLDNEPAKFLVGQEIPITTGEALGSSNSNPFRTIDRKNVGIQLEVTPQINDNGEVRLFIRQEVSSIAASAGLANGEIITNKREMETNVRIKDGEMLILGGLIQQDERLNISKTPLLGDIPVLGKAFSAERKISTKTNLMIFMRTKIVKDSETAQAITQEKFQYIEALSNSKNFRNTVQDYIK